MSKEPNAAARAALDAYQKEASKLIAGIEEAAVHFKQSAVAAYDGDLGVADWEQARGLQTLGDVGDHYDKMSNLLLSLKSLDPGLWDAASRSHEPRILRFRLQQMDLTQVRAYRLHHEQRCGNPSCATMGEIERRLRELGA